MGVIGNGIGRGLIVCFAVFFCEIAVIAKGLPPLPCRNTIALLSKNETLYYLGARLSEVAPNVFALNFKSHGRMSYTFMRPQEFYESPHFRNKIFTRAEFRKWYTRNWGKNGRFSYLSDWGGFNIPSRVLKPFQEGKFDDISQHEALLVQLSKFLGENFYLIGVPSRDRGTLMHEIAHGLYATNPQYRKKIDKVLSQMRLRRIFRELRRIGYHKKVFLDEAQAYLIDRVPTDSVILEEWREDVELLQFQSRLRKIFDQYVR